MSRAYHRYEDLPDCAQAWVDEIWATKSPGWARTAQTWVSRFEAARSERGLSYREAFARRDAIFADLTEASRAKAMNATNTYERWCAQRMDLRPEAVVTTKRAPRQRAAPVREIELGPALERLDVILRRLETIEQRLGAAAEPELGTIVKSLVDQVAAVQATPAAEPVAARQGNERDAAPALIRAQLERIVASIGLEDAAELLGLNLANLTRAMRSTYLPIIDVARLDEVYVAVRAADLDLDVSDVVESMQLRRRRRELDEHAAART